MLKKTLAAVGIAGALIIGSAAAAFADGYPPQAPVTAASATVVPGESTVITATGLGERESVTFTVTGSAGGTLSSIVIAAGAPGASVVKPVVNGTASATFTASGPGTFTITVSDGATILGTTTVTVAGAAAGAGGASGSDLPPTGGTVPAAVIWAGVGAIGLGGIAVAAVAARRRTQRA